jgi:hypothetical protein
MLSQFFFSPLSTSILNYIFRKEKCVAIFSVLLSFVKLKERHEL